MESPWIYIFIGLATVLDILFTVLSGAIKVMELDSRSKNHKDSAKNFSKLYVDTVMELSKYRRNRTDAIKYVGQIHREFLFYEMASPDIPGIINWRYGRKVKEKGLATVGDIGDAIVVETGDITDGNGKRRHHKKRKRASHTHQEFKNEPKIIQKQHTLHNGSMIEKLRNVLQQDEVQSESECGSDVEQNINDDEQDVEKGIKLKTEEREIEKDPHIRYQIDRFTKEI